MSFFNTLNTLAKNFGDVTSDALEGNNVSSRLRKEREEISDVFRVIGEWAYEDYKNGKQFDSDVMDLMKRLDGHVETVKNLENQLGVASRPRQDHGAICSSCGTVNSEGNKFCKQCGNKLISEPIQSKMCSNCGASMTDESAFCGECGTRVE